MAARVLRKTAAASLLALGAFLGVASAQAADLVQAWEAAREHDPQGKVLEAGRAAGAARLQQAEALWRPQVGLTATGALASADSRMDGAQVAMPGSAPVNGAGFATSVNSEGRLTRWALSARQPLYSPERNAQGQQLRLSAQSAQLQFQAGRQEWMLAVSQRYFELVLSQRRLELARQQQQAVERALVEAKDRFKLGDAPVTDTYEAAARARGLQAQVVLATSELDLARQRLADITGLTGEALAALAPQRGVAAPVETLATWLGRVRSDNPQLRLARARADVARAEVARHGALGSASVDLVAQAGRERLAGPGDYAGSAANLQVQRMVGISVNLPLYTGGWQSAKLEEALRLADQAQAEVARAEVELGQQARAAWLGLQAGQERLNALEQGLVSARARLDATRLGRQVGDRTTLDLLNAENEAASAELGLLQARIDLLSARLRLDALAGQLDTPSLQTVNASLQP